MPQRDPSPDDLAERIAAHVAETVRLLLLAWGRLDDRDGRRAILELTADLRQLRRRAAVLLADDALARVGNQEQP